jgi:predicted GNAT family N-acyltransferase
MPLFSAMSTAAKFQVARVTWSQASAALRSVRYRVFVIEQGIEEKDEWDEFDAASLHALATDAAGRAIATGRLLPDGHIGRIAVLQDSRRGGVGMAIVRELIAAARERGDAAVVLHAQTHALGFYRNAGFEPFGEQFMEAGIPHVKMRLVL